MIVRNRDLFAIVIAIILSRMAQQDSLTATTYLSFYLPRRADYSVLPATLDIDGDGTAEALVVLDERDNVYTLQVLDLKPGMRRKLLAPFRPEKLMEATVKLQDETHGVALTPLSMTTGHVVIKDTGGEATIARGAENNSKEINERNRKYFCGSDWHDASQRCHKPCPTGDASQCGPGERCFADTACDYYAFMAKEEEEDVATKTTTYTPAGSVPSILTLWETGILTMHSIVSSKSSPKDLVLEQMWSKKLINATIEDWLNHRVSFIDALSAPPNGLVVITGSFHTENQMDDDGMDYYMPFVLAVNAKTGDIVWESLTEHKSFQPKEQLLLPLVDGRGATSVARRRSLNPNIPDSTGQQKRGVLVSNCMHSYRRSLLLSQALPFLVWDEEDIKAVPIHFEHQNGHSQIHHVHHKKIKGRKQKKLAKTLRFGRPNVVAAKTMDGLEVRSLKNGRPLCHLSLTQTTLYADFNHDGILDSFRILTGEHALEDDDMVPDHQKATNKWIEKLVKQVHGLDGSRDKQNITEELRHQEIQDSAILCHAQVLSGFPSKEELFSVNVCGSKRDQDNANHPLVHVTAAPPLAVETYQNRKGLDLITAVSSGIVTRLEGTTGRKQWQQVLSKQKDFPTWFDESVTKLQQINSKKVVPSTRPILLIGENGFVVLSARRGTILTAATFPQHAVYKHVVTDLNGDGTDDVLVSTADALWGYNIHIQTGGSVGFRLMVGFLLLGLMLALLRNRFGPEPGKRSTDA